MQNEGGNRADEAGSVLVRCALCVKKENSKHSLGRGRCCCRDGFGTQSLFPRLVPSFSWGGEGVEERKPGSVLLDHFLLKASPSGPGFDVVAR